MGQEPEELKQEIAQTREQLADTLDELGERVSPKAATGRATSSAAMTLKRLRHAPMIDSLLGAQYAPLLPLTIRAHLHRWRPRRYRPEHVLVPDGYTAELVAKNFNEPVHCCFDDQGSCYVIECGHKIEAKPRVLKVDVATGEWEVFFELPDDRWNVTGAVTGACWHDGHLYLMNTDTLSRITPDKRLEDLVTDLPGKGDHQSNYPVVGPDGKIFARAPTRTPRSSARTTSRTSGCATSPSARRAGPAHRADRPQLRDAERAGQPRDDRQDRRLCPVRHGNGARPGHQGRRPV